MTEGSINHDTRTLGQDFAQVSCLFPHPPYATHNTFSRVRLSVYFIDGLVFDLRIIARSVVTANTTGWSAGESQPCVLL